MTPNASTQWLFPLSSLRSTPSQCPLDKELYDRARGVEFLYRLGASLNLPTSAMVTAATWFHRFYMRYSMEDFHRQDVAASCIFLATKTEECGRKLRDVARVCQSKVSGQDISQVPADSKEVEQCQNSILLTEEVLLEALCFDLVVESAHAELVDLFDAHPIDFLVQEYAWSLTHDSYRTPMCLLYSPKVIATACFVLAQKVFDGPNSPSLDARISAASPSASLPTPPSHKPASPDASRYAINHFPFTETELSSISEALTLLLEFYATQNIQDIHPYLASILVVPPPTSPKPSLYVPAPSTAIESHDTLSTEIPGRTPNSSHGGHTPVRGPSNRERSQTETKRLDLS